MDDQNNPGGNAPSEPVAGAPSEPAAPPAQPMPSNEPAAPEKCVTCGGSGSGGVCTACGQGDISCTCQPGAPTGGQGGPASEPGGNPPVV